MVSKGTARMSSIMAFRPMTCSPPPSMAVHRGFLDQVLELCLIQATHRGRVAEQPVVTRESYRRKRRTPDARPQPHSKLICMRSVAEPPVRPVTLGAVADGRWTESSSPASA